MFTSEFFQLCGLMLPYNLITGEYLATNTLTMIFSILTVAVIMKLTKEIFKKYFPRTKFKYMAFSCVTMTVGTLIIWLNVAPRFYELITISGLFFAVTGFLLVFKSTQER